MNEGTNLFREFFIEERQYIPKAVFKFKDRCWSSKLRAFYVRPFNHHYLTDYTSVIYPTTYFTSATYVRENPYRATKIEFHEFTHKWDRLQDGFLFNGKYTYPQIVSVPFALGAVATSGPFSWAAFAIAILFLHLGLWALHRSRRPLDMGPTKSARWAFFLLSVPPLVATMVSTVLFGKWFALLWLGAVLFASPWPLKAFWRRDYEIRGYTMSLYAEWLRWGKIRDSILEHYVSQFTSSNYFFMERNAQLVREAFLFQIGRFTQDVIAFEDIWIWGHKATIYDTRNPKRSAKQAISSAKPYNIVRNFMIAQKLTKADI
jgi:hypothetical protein